MLSHKVVVRLLSSASLIAVLGFPISTVKAMEDNNSNSSDSADGSKKRKEVPSSDSSTDVPEKEKKKQKISNDENYDVNNNSLPQNNKKKRKLESSDSSKSKKKVKTKDVSQKNYRWNIPTLSSKQKLELIEKAKQGDEKAMDEVANRYELGFLEVKKEDLENFLKIPNLKEKILNTPGYADILFDFFKLRDYNLILPNLEKNIEKRAEEKVDSLCSLIIIKYIIKNTRTDREETHFLYTDWTNSGTKNKESSASKNIRVKWIEKANKSENPEIKYYLSLIRGEYYCAAFSSRSMETIEIKKMIESVNGGYPHAQYKVCRDFDHFTNRRVIEKVGDLGMESSADDLFLDLFKKGYIKLLKISERNYEGSPSNTTLKLAADLYFDPTFIHHDIKKAISCHGIIGNSDSLGNLESLEKLEQWGAQGYEDAFYELGRYWERNELFHVDEKGWRNMYNKSYKLPPKAMKYYETAAEMGHPEALYRMGLAYEVGITGEKDTFIVPKDVIKAVGYYEKAAENGHSACFYKVGQIFETGVTENGKVMIAKDLKKAYDFYEKAANSKDVESQFKMGHAFETGVNDENGVIIIRTNAKKALDLYGMLATTNHPEGLYKMGQAYETGIKDEQNNSILPQNIKKAYEYYADASKKNHVHSLYKMGFAIEGGMKNENGVPIFPVYSPILTCAKALKFYLHAADLGHADAQYIMAQAYETGFQIIPRYRTEGFEGEEIVDCFSQPKDFQKAFAFYKAAAEKGHMGAMNKMLTLPQCTEEVKKEFLNKLHKNSDGGSQYFLGTLYENGSFGLVKDLNKAVEYYYSAAKKGLVASIDRLKNALGLTACSLLLKYQVGQFFETEYNNPLFGLNAAAAWYYQATMDGNKDSLNSLFALANDKKNSWAQFYLGHLHKAGLGGVKQDLEQAEKYYKLAANQNIPTAQVNLAAIYETKPERLRDAIDLYFRAAQLGDQSALSYLQKLADENQNAFAQYRLASLYHRGAIGIPKDSDQAYKYFQLVLTHGANSEYIQSYFGIGLILFSKLDFKGSISAFEKVALCEEEFKKNAIEGAIKALKGLAEKNPDAQVVMGKVEEKKNKNKAQAYHYYNLAAEQNHPGGQHAVGRLLEEGETGLSKTADPKKAFEYYQKAATQWYAPAQFDMARLLQEGKGVDKDEQKAINVYAVLMTQNDKKAIEALEKMAETNPSAAYRLALMHQKGFGEIKSDPEKALNFFVLAAKKNHPKAQFALGVLYELKKDKEAAKQWYAEASKNGDVPAQSKLATLLEGEDSLKLHIEAAKKGDQNSFNQLQKMADQKKNPDALFGLAEMYQDGLGRPKDLKIAINFYGLAHEAKHPKALAVVQDLAKDNPEAQYLLGRIFERESKIEQAFEEYQKAEKSNHSYAQYILGKWYEEGINVTKNLSEALKYYAKSADQGETEAMYALGKLLLQGTETPKNEQEKNYKLIPGNMVLQDKKKAIRWFHKAMKKGNKPSFERIKELAQSDADAQVLMFAVYWNGNKSLDVEQNASLAFKFLSHAAEQNLPKAQYWLGRLYSDGAIGLVEKNEETALSYWEKAAAQGFAEAQYQVGLTLMGKNEPVEKYYSFLEKAAKQGCKEAQFLMIANCDAIMGKRVTFTDIKISMVDVLKWRFLLIKRPDANSICIHTEKEWPENKKTREQFKTELGDPNLDLMADKLDYLMYKQTLTSLKEQFVDLSCEHVVMFGNFNQTEEKKYTEFKYEIPGLKKAYETLSQFDSETLTLLNNLQKVKPYFMTTFFSPSKTFRTDLGLLREGLRLKKEKLALLQKGDISESKLLTQGGPIQREEEKKQCAQLKQEIDDNPLFFSLDSIDSQSCFTIGEENVKLLETLKANFASASEKCDDALSALNFIHSQYTGWTNTQLTILRQENLEELKTHPTKEEELLKTFNQKAEDLQKVEEEMFGDMRQHIKKEEKAYRDLAKLVHGGLGKLTGVFNRKAYDEDEYNIFDKK